MGQLVAQPSLTDRMIRAARSDIPLYNEVEADTSATSQALTVVALVALASGIGSAIGGLIAGGERVGGLVAGIVREALDIETGPTIATIIVGIIAYIVVLVIIVLINFALGLGSAAVTTCSANRALARSASTAVYSIVGKRADASLRAGLIGGIPRWHCVE